MNKIFIDRIVEKDWSIMQSKIEPPNDNIKIIFIRKELNNEKRFITLINEGYKVIGLSSYQNYPNIIKNPYENHTIDDDNRFIKKHEKYIIGWLHPFMDPENYIPSSIPKIRLSETDFYDFKNNYFKHTEMIDKTYDFICQINEGPWNNWVRQIKIAKKWLNIMAEKLNLNIIVVGSDNRRGFCDKIKCIKFQSYDKFINLIKQSRFYFNSSQYDASPRTIIESLACDVPIMLNRDILGGWKYINKYTGMLFNPDDNIELCIKNFMEQTYTPKKWLYNNVNKNASSIILAKFVNNIINIKLHELVDSVIYINLDSGINRNKSILDELQKYDMPKEKIHHINPIHNKDCIYLGYTQSHIKALELAKEKKWKRYIILEDNFTWNLPKEKTNYMLQKFFNDEYKWDVLMLSIGYKNIKSITDMVKQVMDGTTNTGYIVNGHYTDNLLKNFREGEVLLIKKTEEYIKEHKKKMRLADGLACDQYWKRLQKNGGFYILYPLIGKQK